MKEPVIISRDKFIELVAATFSANELQQLCFGLNMDWDSLAGPEKQSKIVSLIGHVERRGRLEELLHNLRTKRPHVSWPDGLRELDTVETEGNDKQTAVNQQINISGKPEIGSIVQINEVNDGGWLKRLWQSLFR